MNFFLVLYQGPREAKISGPGTWKCSLEAFCTIARIADEILKSSKKTHITLIYDIVFIFKAFFMLILYIPSLLAILILVLKQGFETKMKNFKNKNCLIVVINIAI